MSLVYFIIIIFPASPTDNIDINIVGKYPAAQCEFMKAIFPSKPNHLLVCANLREL